MIGPNPPLKGQDRRMAQKLQLVLLETLSHDNRIGILSAKSRRSRVKFIDPSDVDMTTAVEMLLSRTYWLLGVEQPT